eukprot:4072027-Ditylum_brightwellii.AAC.1
MLMYYARAVDPTMLTSINAITIQQANPTTKTAETLTHLLNYFASHPDAVLRYTTSGMVIHIHSDASFMSETQARSHAGGHFFLSTASKDPSKPPTEPVPLNGPIHM